MSETFEPQATSATNVIAFPLPPPAFNPPAAKKKVATPVYDELIEVAGKLDRISKYHSRFDYSIYRDIELRYTDRPIHGGIVKSNPLKLVNAHGACQQCLYAFEIDTYGRGCSHNCTYCYAKAELTVRGYWNNPIPVPVDLNEIRKVFYTVFETDRPSKWRKIMERRIPLRVGCMSDSFMWSDLKYKVTQELLRILNFYNYPYTIITHSDLVGHDEYIPLFRKDLCSIQLSIPSTNDQLNKLLEPGAPSAKRRLAALSKLSKAGLWTTARINPMFPIYPDGYFTNPNFKWNGPVPKFEYSSFEMVDEIADSGCPSIIAGFGRFSSFSMNNIARATGIDLRAFYNREEVYKSRRDYHFSDKEIRFYYEKLKLLSMKRAIEFTVCYIGNGENQFWDHQDLWSNKSDCCNIKGKVSSFKNDTREIPFSDRAKLGSFSTATPTNSDTLHRPLGKSHPSEAVSIQQSKLTGPSPL
ncbi:MAG: radical SAM protein [Pseudobdellovibrionaceae bacterium]